LLSLLYTPKISGYSSIERHCRGLGTGDLGERERQRGNAKKNEAPSFEVPPKKRDQAEAARRGIALSNAMAENALCMMVT
jgi:hypothetical protein